MASLPFDQLLRNLCGLGSGSSSEGETPGSPWWQCLPPRFSAEDAEDLRKQEARLRSEYAAAGRTVPLSQRPPPLDISNVPARLRDFLEDDVPAGGSRYNRFGMIVTPETTPPPRARFPSPEFSIFTRTRSKTKRAMVPRTFPSCPAPASSSQACSSQAKKQRRS